MNAYVNPRDIPGNVIAANEQARAIVLSRAVDRVQPIATFAPGTDPRGTTTNIPVRNVGLLKRLFLEISFTLTQAAAETLTRSAWGPANIIKQLVLTDLSNNMRINTTGWHLHSTASVKRGRPFGAAFTSDTPTGMASNFGVIQAAATVTTAQTIRMFFEVPIAYGDRDLRGAIYASVVNATMNLQITWQNFVVGSAASDVQAAYKSSTANDIGLVTNFSCTVYQHYLDQIPMSQNGGPILPVLDMSTAYLLNNTVQTGIAQNEDNPIPYANFRQFMSTVVIYDRNGTLAAGTDINRFKMETANFTNLFDVTPRTQQLFTRNLLGDDFPLGSYYFDHRAAPVDTLNYGNMQLIVNPSTAASTTQMLIGFEALAFINQVVLAGSLSGGR